MKKRLRRFFNALIARGVLKRWQRPPRADDARGRETAVLKAFRNAVRRQGAYREFLSKRGVDPDSIRTVRDFELKVPTVAKGDIFDGEGLRGFFARDALTDMATLYTSSGFSSRFAFGALSRADAGRIAFFVEEILFPLYGIRERDLLVVNCLSLGTEIPLSRHPQAKTGLRSDSVVEVLRRAASEFGGVAVAGESVFLKRVVEEGTAAGLPWEKMKIWIFTGSEYVSEHWRSHLRSLLGQDPERPENGGIYLTYGLTEFGLAVGFETAPLAALRRALVARDAAGRGAAYAGSRPPFMHYIPGLYRIETAPAADGTPELVITALDRRRLVPLVRYRTGDEAELHTPDEIGGMLSRRGLGGGGPVLRLPAFSLHGRRMAIASDGVARVTANDVKDALFMAQETARAVTGNFRVTGAKTGGRPRLLVQLAPGFGPDKTIAGLLAANLEACGAGGFGVDLYSYRDYPFGFEHEYERKTPYVD